MRGTKRKAEDEGEHEGAKRQDGMIVGCLGAEEVTRRNIHEALTTRGRRYYFGSAEESNDKDVSMAMYVPTQEDHEDELTEAWDDIDGQQLDPEVVRKARAPEMEWCRKMIVFEKRPIEECFEKTWKPPIRVKWVDHNKGDRQKHEREIQAGGKANQHRRGTRFLRGDAATLLCSWSLVLDLASVSVVVILAKNHSWS